jgi:RNA polymerase sigma-70 factor (ECF subfamily)
MPDARDADDKRLLEAGDHRQLLENYFSVVRELAFLRTRDREAAEEVAQRVFLRLSEELERGAALAVPFRVRVHNVVRWTAAGHDWRTKPDATIPEGWDPPDEDDELERWAAEHDMRALVAELPDGQREAVELVDLEGLSPAQAAERLGIARNAVDQRLHNGHRKLAEKLGG